jgi:hypothetical protein
VSIDTDNADEAVHLGLHEGNCAWKGFDWEPMQRLHAKGYLRSNRQGEVGRVHRCGPVGVRAVAAGALWSVAVVRVAKTWSWTYGMT